MKGEEVKAVREINTQLKNWRLKNWSIRTSHPLLVTRLQPGFFLLFLIHLFSQGQKKKFSFKKEAKTPMNPN